VQNSIDRPKHMSSKRANWLFVHQYVSQAYLNFMNDTDDQLRRTMQTMLLSYPTLLKRLEDQGKPPIILDIVQEVKDVPSDTPSYPVEELKNAKDGMFAHLDFSTLSPEYASKKGIYHPDNVADRAREVRKWLRARDEQGIVGVSCVGSLALWEADG
jgi:hypothetical protein